MNKKLTPDVEKVKTRAKSKMGKTKKGILLLAFVTLVAVGGMIYVNIKNSGDIEIATLNTSVPQDGRVVEENLVKDTMAKKDFDKRGMQLLKDGSKRREIVLWSDRAKVINTYASYYIRRGTPIYWDSLSKESPKKYAYLYKMDGELLKLDMKADQFGKMLVPGDKITVRASYKDQITALPSEKSFMMQQMTGVSSSNSTVDKQIKLFNNAVVLDILNSSGDSIFDIYYKLLALPKAQQLTYMADSTFMASVVPVEILLNVTPEEADAYMSIKSKGPQYMMTLMPRTSGNLITEALNELQTGFARATK